MPTIRRNLAFQALGLKICPTESSKYCHSHTCPYLSVSILRGLEITSVVGGRFLDLGRPSNAIWDMSSV